MAKKQTSELHVLKDTWRDLCEKREATPIFSLPLSLPSYKQKRHHTY